MERIACGGTHGARIAIRAAAQGLLLLAAGGAWAADQLLANPSFDTNVASWNKSGGGTLSSFATGLTGKCLRHASRAASSDGPYQSIKSDFDTYGKGLYRASAWVYLATATDTGRIELGTKIGTTWTWRTFAADVPPNQWTLVTATAPVTWEGTLADAWFIVNTGNTKDTLYVDDCSLEAVAAEPVAEPEPGSYDHAVAVTLTCATPETTIRYTLDGTTPDAENGTDYTGPLSLSATATLKAVASRSGWVDSDVFEGRYDVSSGTILLLR